MSLIPYIITMVMLLSLGTVFFMGKGASFIAGYNTMSKEEQEKVDGVALAKRLGKLIYFIAVLFTLYYVLNKQGNGLWANIIWLIIILSAFIFTFMKGKYPRK